MFRASAADRRARHEAGGVAGRRRTHPGTRRDARAPLVIVVAGLATGFVACRGPADTAPPPSPASTSATSSSAPSTPVATDEAVERLRSLGYVGFSKPRPSEIGSGVVRNEGRSYRGYNFFVNPTLCLAVLMDPNGRPVNTWEGSHCHRWASAEFLPNGDLIITGTGPGTDDPDAVTARRFLLKLAWTGQTIWKREYPAHHDVNVGPDGTLLTLTAAHRAVPAINAQLPLRDNGIAHLSADGAELEHVSMYDLFAAAPHIAPLLLPRVPAAAQDLDLFHANAVERVDPTKRLPSGPLYSTSNVLVTVRHQDVVFIMDWRSRRLLWAWGRGELSGPHHATLIPGGHLLVFDNGLARGASRVLEVDPLTRAIVWKYEAPPGTFFTRSRGSNQRLPNGNTLIGESDQGRAFEVTPAGTIVWEFLNPLQNDKGERAAFYRMTRIEPAVIERIVATRGPGRAPAKLVAMFGH